MKFKTYAGETLDDVEVSWKIDGVRGHLLNGEVVSRARKPLYNIPPIHNVFEVFLGNWEKTLSAVSSKNRPPIPEECLYSLDPMDPRLFVGYYKTIDAVIVKELLTKAIALGHEGLVLRTPSGFYKVKDHVTYDVLVTGLLPGRGKHRGMIGAVVTPMGNVGSGFTMEQRKSNLIGKVIEVRAMSLTPNGKFRHPRFIRVRDDKLETE